MVEKFHILDWSLETSPDDGGRISKLSYKGNHLLCGAPEVFRPPKKDYGLYETRPVYGYDDCFPSVDRCKFPSAPEFEVPDHGELCWQKWAVEKKGNVIEFKTASMKLPLEFMRRLEFSDNTLTWTFEVSNHGKGAMPFLHVMHPLMPLASVDGFIIPEFASAFDEVNQREISLPDGRAVEKYLLNQRRGEFSMLLLRGIKDGRMTLSFKFPINLEIVFPEKLFPSIGIWWNNNGYPDEVGLRRCECAFEPIPGNTSSLESCFRDGKYLSVQAGSVSSWNVKWVLDAISDFHRN